MLHGKAVGIMPNPLDSREIFFTNLLLVGFDPAAMELKEKIPFNRDMFVLPNKKAMEIVMHFLFAKLNPQLAYEEFRNCWPVKNKAEEQQFRKTCYTWVSRISTEEPDASLPRVVQSLFHSPGGERFYNFLLLFSLFVLRTVMLRDHSKNVVIPPFPSKNIHNKSFTDVISKSIKTQTAVHRERFLDFTQYSLEVQQHWKLYSMEVTKENRSLKKKMRDLERQLRGVASTGTGPIGRSLGKNEYQIEVDAIKRTQQIQKVRGLWSSIEDLYSAHELQREILTSVLDGEANKHHLDTTETQVKVPDLLLREFERELHTKKIENTYIGGKLNLLSLIQLWNLSLHLLRDKIQQDSVPSFEENSSKLRNKVHTHQSYLTNAETLRSTLAKKTIPELKISIEELKSQIYQEMSGGSDGSTSFSFRLDLGLAHATPPVSFMAAATPVSERITSFQESLRRSPVGVSTPDVVNAWTESLRGRIPPANSTHLSGTQPQHQKTLKQDDRLKFQPSHIPRPVHKDTSTYSKKAVAHTTAKKTDLLKSTRQQHASDINASARRPTTSVVKKDVVTPVIKGPRKRITSWTEPRKKAVLKTPNQRVGERAWAVGAVADQIIGAMSVDEPASGSSSRTSSRASTPQAHALNDPVAALDQTAFDSHDLICRTPAPKEKYAPTPVNHTKQSLDGDRSTHNDDDYTLHASTTSSGQQRSATEPPNRPGRLLETILDQANDCLTPDKIKTALFKASPDHGNLFTRCVQGTSSENDSPVDFSLTSPTFKEDGYDDNPLSPFSFLTPESYVTSSSAHKTSERESETVLSPFAFQTPFLQKERQPCSREGPMTELSGTPFASKREEHFGKHGRDLEVPTTNDGTPSTADLGSNSSSKYFTSTAECQLLDFSPDYLNSGTKHKDGFSNLKLTSVQSPWISLSQPTVARDGFSVLFGDEDSDVDVLLEARKRSPFGNLEIDSKDVESAEDTNPKNKNLVSLCGENEDTLPEKWFEERDERQSAMRLQSSAIAKQSPIRVAHTSDLMERLNKIKESQRRDVRYNTSIQGPGTRHEEEWGMGNSERRAPVCDVPASMETLQARRLDQILEAQRSQLVTPGADTQTNHDTSRESEPALLTPLTASSTGTPENDATDHAAKFTFQPPGTPPGDIIFRLSERSSPSSIISERFLLQTHSRDEKDRQLSESPLRRVFTLESSTPSTPDNIPRGIRDLHSPWSISSLHFPVTPSQDRLRHTTGHRGSAGTPSASGNLSNGVPTPEGPSGSGDLGNSVPTPVLPSRWWVKENSTQIISNGTSKDSNSTVSRTPWQNTDCVAGSSLAANQAASPAPSSTAVGTLIDLE